MQPPSLDLTWGWLQAMALIPEIIMGRLACIVTQRLVTYLSKIVLLLGRSLLPDVKRLCFVGTRRIHPCIRRTQTQDAPQTFALVFWRQVSPPSSDLVSNFGTKRCVLYTGGYGIRLTVCFASLRFSASQPCDDLIPQKGEQTSAPWLLLGGTHWRLTRPVWKKHGTTQGCPPAGI